MLANKTNGSIEKFTESFFKNLGCLTVWEDSCLVVTRVPKKFEAFVGKTSPYRLVFREGDLVENSELIIKGGFFLNAIAEFLKSKSKISLIKIPCVIDPVKEVNERFTFLNSKIESVGESKMYDLIIRFTFASTFQYLNEKDSETIKIDVHDGKIFPLDISNKEFIQGKKDEVRIPDIKEDYDVAKVQLKKIINDKNLLVGEMLSKKLVTERTRIEKHFDQQKKEYVEENQKLISQIEQFEKELIFTKEDKNKILKKLDRLKEQQLKNSSTNRLDILDKEKRFFFGG